MHEIWTWKNKQQPVWNPRTWQYEINIEFKQFISVARLDRKSGMHIADPVYKKISSKNHTLPCLWENPSQKPKQVW
jgi:hypothetical protein